MHNRNTAKTSDTVGISREERNNLTAVVFDANAFGHGRPVLNELIYLAKRLAQVGLETWIPEPVAWEWAQHLSKDWAVAKASLGTENHRIRKAGLTEFQSPYADAENVAQAFLKKIEDEPLLKMIPLSSKSARLGLRDQIMQLPPGRLKSDVKTGASDSAWLRDVLEKTDGDVSKVLFVSEDKDIDAALEFWDKPSPLKRPRRDLLATVFHVELNEAATKAVIRYLLNSLPIQDGDLLEIGGTPTLRSAVESVLNEGPIDFHVENATISRVTKLSGVVSVVAEIPKKRSTFDQVDSSAPHTATARLMLLADADAVVRVEGSEDERDVLSVPDLLLRADIAFDLAQGAVTATRPAGEIVAFGYNDAFDNDRDAYLTTLDEISGSIPGLNFWDKLAETGSGSFEAQINEHDISVDFTQVDAGEWTLAVTVDNETTELSCWYDVGARVWDAPDSFDMPGAYHMGFDESDTRNPMWALTAWTIERLYS